MFPFRRSARWLAGLCAVAVLSLALTWLALGRSPHGARLDLGRSPLGRRRLVPAWPSGTSASRLGLGMQRDIQNHTLQSVCRREGLATSPFDLDPVEQRTLFRHIIVNDRFKFLYCYVPKVACSNWKKVIKVLDGKLESVDKKVKMDHRKDLTFLSDLPAEEIQIRLRSYYKFMFVRDPMERLLSAYRDKFANKAIVDFPLKYGRDIVRRYRDNPPDNVTGTDVTFGEFVRYLLDTDVRDMNEHWQPYLQLCQPCAVTYDFIGTQKNLEADAAHVLAAVRAPQGVRFPQRQSWYKPTDRKALQRYLSEVPPQALHSLIPKYSMDFVMFGYPTPELDTP